MAFGVSTFKCSVLLLSSAPPFHAVILLLSVIVPSWIVHLNKTCETNLKKVEEDGNTTVVYDASGDND